MPRIRRYLPLSHDFLDDPETDDMILIYGLRAVLVWIRMLSIGDRNDGILKGGLMTWVRALLRDFSDRNPRWVRRDSDKLLSLLRWMSEKHWIEVREGSEPSLRIVNHGKYHRTRDTKEDQLGGSKDSPLPNPSEHSQPSEGRRQEPPNGGPVDNSSKETGLDPGINAKAVQLFNSDPSRFSRIFDWIKQKESKGYEAVDIEAALAELWTKEKKNGQLHDWWAYMEWKDNGGHPMIERVRTKRLQGEPERLNRRPSEAQRVVQ